MNTNVKELPFGADDQNDAISERASLWLAQREEGFTREQADEFDRWLESDPRHAAAIAELEQTCALLEQLPFVAERLHDLKAPDLARSCEFPANAASRRTPWRKRYAARAVAIAAALALSAVGWQWWGGPVEAPTRYTTTPTGYERIILADGSMLELNAATDLRVEFSAIERRVTLTTGEAHFSVARDLTRPFVVNGGGISVRAVGTAFNVRIGVAEVEVLVTEGTVQVGSERHARTVSHPQPVIPEHPLIQAGERVVIPKVAVTVADVTPPRVEKVAPAAMWEALSWQERKLVFSETPLSEVIAQFNRRNFTQIVILDEELGSRPVGGVFASDNVGAFVRLLEEAGDVIAENGGDREVILRKAH